MTNCEFLKYLFEKRCFSTYFDVKIHRKTTFFEQIFEKFTISHEFVLSQEFEDFESMSMWFPVSNICVKSSLLSSGTRKNFIFFPTDRSWNNYLHISLNENLFRTIELTQESPSIFVFRVCFTKLQFLTKIIFMIWDQKRKF